jgi:hypothetical protein
MAVTGNNKSSDTAASILFCAALAIIIATEVWWVVIMKAAPDYKLGGVAAIVGLLLVLDLILKMPLLIYDDERAKGGEPSTIPRVAPGRL